MVSAVGSSPQISGITPSPLNSFLASSIERSALGSMISDLIISCGSRGLPFSTTKLLSSVSFFLNSVSSDLSVLTSSTIALSVSLSFLSVLPSTVNCPRPIMRTILLLGAMALLFLALAIAVFLLRVLIVAFLLLDTTLLERDLPFPVRLDLSLVAANLPLLFAFGLIVVLLAPLVVSSYVVSLTLTLLILRPLSFVR